VELLVDFFKNILYIANAMSFYILIGVVIAGVLKEVIPNNFISKHLGDRSFSAIIKATILGIPLPLCSCSVIPMAKSLQKEGASRGAVSSFLVSTPITGVDSILATYSLFGWFFTIYRVVTSIFIAIFVGFIQNFTEKPKPEIKFTINRPKSSSLIFNSSSCDNSCCGSFSSKRKEFNIERVFDYAFNTLFRDIAKPLAIGLIVGAIFSTLFPKELLSLLTQNSWLSYIFILIVSMPLYVCATSSLPIALSFILNGMSLGVAFIFLTAGPATNSVTMSVVSEMFGRVSLVVYIGVIAIFSIFFGFLLDILYSDTEMVLEALQTTKSISILDIISTTIMFLLIFKYIRGSFR